MAKPFVKWAGGKTQLIPEIQKYVDQLHGKFDEFTLVEPFVGGGAVFLYFLEEYPNMHAVINDLNEQLINCYRVIKDPVKFPEFKKKLFNQEILYNISAANGKGKEEFLLWRDLYNKHINSQIYRCDVDAAVMFVFLNKTCFNGMYRVNSKGEYNVPWGQKKEISLFDEDNINKVHELLQRVDIMCGSYEETLSLAGESVEFYLDPPYKPISATSSFNSYTKDEFGDEQQEDLKMFCDSLTAAGSHFIESNSKVGTYFDDLYSGYFISLVSARRNINSKGGSRGKIDEILISDFEINASDYSFELF